MKLVQFILLISILFYTTNGQTVNTTTLDPYLHYINITIRYHAQMIIGLFQNSRVILPEYGIVLASCYLNVSRGEVTSTTYSTTELVIVEITNFNISLFFETYTIRQFSDENDSGDTIVKFEFYLTQNGTFILATDAIEVFNTNCDTNNWKDSFTSDSILASASFSSKQTSLSLLTSSIASSSIYTSSSQYISSIASVVSTHFSQQVSTPIITSQTLPSGVIEVNTTPLSVETTSAYSSSVQTQVNPSTASISSRIVPSISQSAVPTSLASLLAPTVGVLSQPSLTSPITATQYVTADSQSVFESTTNIRATANRTAGIGITQSDRVPTSTPFLVLASSSLQSVIPQIHTSSSIPVLSSQALSSQSASSIHGPFQPIINQTSNAVIQTSQSLRTSNKTLQYSVSSSSNASTPTLTLNTPPISTSMSLLVSSRIVIDLSSSGILESSLSSNVHSSVTNVFVPSSTIYSTQHIVRPSATSTRPLVPMSSQTQSIVSLQNSTAIIQQPSYSTSSIRQPIISTSSSIRQPIIPTSSISSSGIPSRLLASSIVPLSTTFIEAHSLSSVSTAAVYQTTSLLSAVHSLTSAVSRMLAQTGITQVSSSVQAPFYSNTSTAVHSETSQFVVPTHSVPQQPSAVFNTSQLPITTSISQLSSTHFINTSTLINRVQSLTTQPPLIPTATPIQSTVLPSASPVEPTSIPQVSPSRHYLIATFEYTVSSFEIGQSDDNINSTITAIASRYHNLTTQTAIAMYTVKPELISVRIYNLTVTAIRSEYSQSLMENLATRRVVFYVTDNTALLLATQAKAVLDTYSIDEWAESTGLQTSSVTFELEEQIQTSLMFSSTVTVSSQLSPSIPILTTTVIPTTSLTTQPMLSTSSTAVNLSLIVSSLQPATSSSIHASRITTSRQTVLTTLSGQIQQSLPSSSLQTTPILATQSVSIPVQLIRSSSIHASRITSTRQTVLTSLSGQIQQSLPSSSLQTTPILATQSVSIPVQLIRSSSIHASRITSTRQTVLTSLSGQIQQSLPSSSLQTTPILATQSVSIPVQLMTSSLRQTLVTLSSNRSALSIPGPSTTESPVISMTSSLIFVLNSSQPSQPISQTHSQFPLSSIITTQAVQPSLAVTNTTSLPTMSTANSTQSPTSTGFVNTPVRIMTSSPIISRTVTRTSIVSMIQNSSSSQLVSLSSQMNTSSISPTQRISLSHSIAPSPNSTLQQSTQTVPPSTTTPPLGYHVLTDFNPGVGYLLQLTLNISETKVNLTRDFYLNRELDLISLYSIGLDIAEPSANNRRKRDVFNTTNQIACGIIESLTNAVSNQLIIVFYISREKNGLPLTIVTANRSKYIFDQLEPGNYTATLGYGFLSLSIYQEMFVDPHRLAIIVGTTLGCCTLIMLVFLVVLCLYHCLHSNYIRADKWSPNMSIAYSDKGVYTGSTTKLMNEDEFEMELTRCNSSEGTQTLARDFLSGYGEYTRNSADYAFTLRTKPNLFSPFQVEETLSPIAEATNRSSDEIEKSPLDTAPAPTISQLRTEIEEERRRAKRAEASLLEIMTSNRKHLADAPLFSDTSEARRAEERANTAYERSKKEMSVVTGAVTPSSSYGSSLSSSRGVHRPWSGRGNKVAPSKEPSGELTPQPKIHEQQSVSSKSSKSMQLSGFRNVRPPNIMQVEPTPINGPILVTPPPAYDHPPIKSQVKPIPVRVFRTDGHPVQIHPSVPNTPVTATINVLPSFNPFYTSAKKEHTSL